MAGLKSAYLKAWNSVASGTGTAARYVSREARVAAAYPKRLGDRVKSIGGEFPGAIVAAGLPRQDANQPYHPFNNPLNDLQLNSLFTVTNNVVTFSVQKFTPDIIRLADDAALERLFSNIENLLVPDVYLRENGRDRHKNKVATQLQAPAACCVHGLFGRARNTQSRANFEDANPAIVKGLRSLPPGALCNYLSGVSSYYKVDQVVVKSLLPTIADRILATVVIIKEQDRQITALPAGSNTNIQNNIKNEQTALQALHLADAAGLFAAYLDHNPRFHDFLMYNAGAESTTPHQNFINFARANIAHQRTSFLNGTYPNAATDLIDNRVRQLFAQIPDTDGLGTEITELFRSLWEPVFIPHSQNYLNNRMQYNSIMAAIITSGLLVYLNSAASSHARHVENTSRVLTIASAAAAFSVYGTPIALGLAIGDILQQLVAGVQNGAALLNRIQGLNMSTAYAATSDPLAYENIDFLKSIMVNAANATQNMQIARNS